MMNWLMIFGKYSMFIIIKVSKNNLFSLNLSCNSFLVKFSQSGNFKSTENYASLSKKKPQMTQEEANSKLKTQHWNAVLSDFQYQRALELVDRQKSVEIAAQVC